MEERLSKNLTVGDLGGSECVRRGERGVSAWKDGVSEPSAYDNMTADVEIRHWFGSGLIVHK